MIRRCLFAIPAAVLLLSGAGCIVTRTSYETKARETDNLRSALASLNREKTKLAEENAALSGQVAAGKKAEAALSAQVKEMDDSLKRLGEGLTGSPSEFGKGRFTRERFIDELLEGEKNAGRRMEEMSARAEACEKNLEAAGRETGARDTEIDDLRFKLSVCSGRIERIREEERGETLGRDEKLARLSSNLEGVSPEIGVTSMGSALRIVVPEALLVGKQGGKLTKTGTAIVSEVSGAVSDLPSASLVIITGGKNAAETVRAAAAGGGIQQERLLSRIREKGSMAEFLVIVP